MKKKIIYQWIINGYGIDLETQQVKSLLDTKKMQTELLGFQRPMHTEESFWETFNLKEILFSLNLTNTDLIRRTGEENNGVYLMVDTSMIKNPDILTILDSIRDSIFKVLSPILKNKKDINKIKKHIRFIFEIAASDNEYIYKYYNK